MNIDEFNQNFTFANWRELLQRAGFRPNNLKGQYPTFTRAGKRHGVSVQLQARNGILFLHNFSSSTGLTKANGKTTFSPAEYIVFTAFNGNWHNFAKHFEVSCESYAKSEPKASEQPKMKFNKDLLLVNEAGERLYRISVFNDALNKSVGNFHQLSSSNNPKEFNSGTIEKVIKLGAAMTLCHYQATKKSDNWRVSDLFGIDVDNNAGNYLSIEQALELPVVKKFAILLYTTCSHTTEHHKFRILFELPEPTTDRATYEFVIKQTIDLFNRDFNADHTSDVCRLWFGNTNAIFYYPTLSE